MAKKVLARVNHGRWLADCPDCRGAELVYPGEPFICLSCFKIWPPSYPKPRDMEGVKTYANLDEVRKDAALLGRLYDVEFPPEKADIEKLINKRPTINQNWEFFNPQLGRRETLDDLRLDNKTFGVK